MSFEEKTAEIEGSLKCKNCGALLHFKPGTHSLQCEYCSTVNEIDVPPAGEIKIRAVDYDTFITESESTANTREAIVVKCTNCGASTTLQPGITASTCPFCASPLVVNINSTRRIQKPHYVLPFIIKKETAVDNFNKWLKGLWWAPSDLSKTVSMGAGSQLQGVYIPHWSYDADTVTRYTGQRGEYRYRTETYTAEVDGRTEIRTRQVRYTEWYPASGVVSCSFRDVLVSASPSLPQKTASTLEPWHLEQLVQFDERFLSGFRAETFQTSPTEGLAIAKRIMDPAIRNTICADIGGDDQQISNYNSEYNNKGIKYIMLPVWLNAYRYNGKVYQFVVNACTGEVVGERPWSWVKIALAILAGILAIAAISFFLSQSSNASGTY